MIDRLLLVLHYTGLLALCLPSLFFILITLRLNYRLTLVRSDANDELIKHNVVQILFWGGVCAAEYLLVLGVEYVGGVL